MSEVDRHELSQVIKGSLSTEPDITLLARPAVAGLPTVGLWRVAVDGRSVVLKVLRYDEAAPKTAWSADPDPAHPFYWRRDDRVPPRPAPHSRPAVTAPVRRKSPAAGRGAGQR